MKVMGIDPGFTGAMATIDVDLARQDLGVRLTGISDMPLLIKKDLFSSKKANSKSIIDISKLTLLIKDMAPEVAFLEQVHAAPDQGVVSMFRFGEGFGILQGILNALNIRVVLVHPSVWKLSMGLSKNKELSIKRAAELIGESRAAKFLTRKRDHGRAEAILLAHYGVRSLGFSSQGGGNGASILF